MNTDQQAVAELHRMQRLDPIFSTAASRFAFDDMEDSGRVGRLLAFLWNNHVDSVAHRRDELRDDAEYRATYDAVILATEPAAKAVAIRRHLRAWGARRAEGVG